MSANSGGFLSSPVIDFKDLAQQSRRNTQRQTKDRHMKGLIDEGDMSTKLHRKSRALCVNTSVHY